MTIEEQVNRWVRQEYERIRMEDQAVCNHKRSGSLALGAGDVVVCDDCKKEITFDYACRRPPKT